MKTLQQYWNEAFRRPDLKPVYDNWLDKYWGSLHGCQHDGLIVDLGCGIGNNAQYLSERGIRPVACDISEVAIQQVEDKLPGIETRCFDMSEGLPFDDASVSVLIADLSLHYFDEGTTRSIIHELHRVLKTDGLLLCRLNAVEEIGNKGVTEPAEEEGYLLKNEGICRRFFDLPEIYRFFREDRWAFVHEERYGIDRYAKRKILWEIALKPKRLP